MSILLLFNNVLGDFVLERRLRNGSNIWIVQIPVTPLLTSIYVRVYITLMVEENWPFFLPMIIDRETGPRLNKTKFRL